MIVRPKYLKQLIDSKENGFPKVITGIRRCGKSFLLKEIYYEYLLSIGISKKNIIIIELDSIENTKYHDPFELNDYILNQCKDDSMYYVFIDEIQLVDTLINPIIFELLNCSLYNFHFFKKIWYPISLNRSFCFNNKLIESKILL